MTDARPGRRSYEITLAGKLGPVLRAMTERSTTVSSEVQRVTIMRVRGRDDEDLLDLVLRLRSPGLEVTSVTTIPPGPDLQEDP